MKENFTLEVFYDYADPDSDPEGATIYQWYTYDDNFGTNKTPIRPRYPALPVKHSP
jgi:hypothetical protein